MKKQIGLFFGAVTLAAIFGLFLSLTDRPSTVSAQSGSSCSGPYIQTGTGQNCVFGLGPGSIASPSTTAPIINGTAAAGTSAAYSRGDHVHPTDTSRQIALLLIKGTYADGDMCTYATTGTLLNCNTAITAASTTTPSMDGTANYGSGTTFARADHIHPTDTTRLPVNNPAAVGVVAIAAVANPSAPTVTRTCAGSCSAAWAYEVVYNGAVGSTVSATSADGVANNATTLDVTHYNTITSPTCPAGVSTYSVYRTEVETSPSTVGKITASPVACGANVVDNGLAGNSASAPTVNTTGGIFAPNMKATTNPYFVCVDISGNIYSSATACYTPPS